MRRFKKLRKPNKKLKPGELTVKILEVIGLGLLASSGNRRPMLPIMVKEIARLIQENTDWGIGKTQINRTLKQLETKEILYLEEQNDSVFVHIKDQSRDEILKYSIKPLLELKKKDRQWDGNWFMVFFDVPEIQRNKRDYLRKFLDKVGFYRYQKSVYIFPFECEKEVALIKKLVEGGKYLKYIIAKKIEDEEIIKTYFHLN